MFLNNKKVCTIIRKVWQHQRERWQYRNTKLHKNSKQQATKENLLARIKGIYTKQNVYNDLDIK